MIACCGLDCSNCEAYLATWEDNDIKRAKVAKETLLTKLRLLQPV